jgi:hypothetical protein
LSSIWPSAVARREAVGLVQLDAAEVVAVAVRRAPEQERALGAERADLVAGGEAALGQPQLVVGAAGDREVALPRIVGALDDAQGLDQLGDHEVQVGVAVAVQVAGLVDHVAVDPQLDVLALAGVEAAQEDLLRVALAAFVGEQEAGGPAE